MADPGLRSGVGLPSQQGQKHDLQKDQKQPHVNNADRTTQSLLNSYIYDYLIKKDYCEAARAFGREAQVQTLVRSQEETNSLAKRHKRMSPVAVKHEGISNNESSDENMNVNNGNLDSFSSSSAPPPPPILPIDSAGGFLIEWWNVFWDIYNARRGQGSEPAKAYMSHISNLRKKSRLNLQEIQKNSLHTGNTSHPYANASFPHDPANAMGQQIDSSQFHQGAGGLNDRNQHLMRQAMLNNQSRETFPPTAAQLQQLKQLHYRQLQSVQQQQKQHQQKKTPQSGSTPQMQNTTSQPTTHDTHPPKQQGPISDFRSIPSSPKTEGAPSNAQFRPSLPATPNGSVPQSNPLYDTTGLNGGQYPVAQNSAQPLLHEINFASNRNPHLKQGGAVPSSTLPQQQKSLDKPKPAQQPSTGQFSGNQMNQYGFSNSPYSQNMLYNFNGNANPSRLNPALKNYMEELKLLEQQNKKRLLLVSQEKERKGYTSASPDRPLSQTITESSVAKTKSTTPKSTDTPTETTTSPVKVSTKNSNTTENLNGINESNMPMLQNGLPLRASGDHPSNYSNLIENSSTSDTNNADNGMDVMGNWQLQQTHSSRPTPNASSPLDVRSKQKPSSANSNAPTPAPTVNTTNPESSTNEATSVGPALEPSQGANVHKSDSELDNQNQSGKSNPDTSATPSAPTESTTVATKSSDNQLLDVGNSTDIDAALLNDFDFDKFLKDTSTGDDLGFGLFNLPDNEDSTAA